MAQRTPAEIRSSIESNRMELAVSLDRLRGEVAHLTDWRGHVERHRSEADDGGRGRGPCARRPLPAPPAPSQLIRSAGA